MTRQMLSILTLTLPSLAMAGEYTPLWDSSDYGLYSCSLFNNETVVQTDNQVEPAGRHYTQFGGLGPMWTWSPTGSDKIWVHSGGRWQLLADFGAAVGDSWDVDIDPCNHGTATLRTDSATLNTEAGTFNKVAVVDFTQTTCADAGVGSMAFARGVGLVSWSHTTIAGPVTCELSRASIDGKKFPVKEGFNVDGKFETTQAWINMMPPGPHPIQEVSASITVTNSTEWDMRFQFNSGQRFDVHVVDANGNIVSSWSRDKFFTDAIYQLDLDAGESWNFGGNVELADADGNHLAPGAYTLRVELSTSGEDGTDQSWGSASPSVESPLFIGYAY